MVVSGLHFGDLVDPVESGGKPANVKLTKFNPLQEEAKSQSTSASTESSINKIGSLSDSGANLSNLSAIDLVNRQQLIDELRQEIDRGHRWPWLSSGNEAHKSEIHNFSGSPRSLDRNQQVGDGTEIPFQIVWRRLSFEVRQNPYSLFAKRALKTLQTLSGFGERSRANEADQLEGGQIPDDGWNQIIFENLNGCVKSGEISAILGPSGAGKTTLLNAICGRVDNYRGSVQLIGGGERRMRLSIIPQKDYLIETLTVRENLLYSSKLLNPEDGYDHNGNIMRVVKMLNLLNCLDSRSAKISGGEYKRVSIAQELLRQPDILILDEPTSGLDSMNCKNLVECLVQMIDASRRGNMKQIAVVLTIHQPDVDVFNMFDHVYCMAKRGRVIFDGHPSEAMKVLARHSPQILTGGSYMNPANLLIEIASDMHGEQIVSRLAQSQRKQFEPDMSSRMLGSSKPSDSHLGDGERPAHLTQDKRLVANYKNEGRLWYHTKILAKRAFLSTIRDPLLTLAALIFHLTIPFVMWAIYTPKIGTADACPIIQRDIELLSVINDKTIRLIADLQEEMIHSYECCTMLFLTTYSFCLCTTSIAALAFPLSMQVLLKEVRNGWYNQTSFVVAKTIANFPFEVLLPVISITMVYLLIGMPSSYMEWRLLGMALAVGLASMIANAQGLIFGALCMDSIQSAIFLAIAVTLPQVLLSGYTARIKTLPMILQKLSWLSPNHYTSDIMNIIRFGFGLCPCDESTDEYLRTKQPSFSDTPSSMGSVFDYYLTNVANEQTVSSATIPPNVTMPLANSSLVELMVSNTSRLLIPGISEALTVSASDRADMISKIESDEVDVLGRMAVLVAKSFSFGRDIDSCDSVRSELLLTTYSPGDEYLPLLFGGLFAILVVTKMILFVVVKHKIRSQI